jgi:hypothetical protein
MYILQRKAAGMHGTRQLFLSFMELVRAHTNPPIGFIRPFIGPIRTAGCRDGCFEGNQLVLCNFWRLILLFFLCHKDSLLLFDVSGKDAADKVHNVERFLISRFIGAVIFDH